MTQWIARRRTLFFALIAMVLLAAIAVGCTFTDSDKDQEPIDPDTSSSSDTSEDQEDDKQEEKSLLEGVLGTPLTDQALAYFQTLFAHVNAEKEEDINWYNIILSCGWNFTDDKKGFTVPQDVNLGTLFNNGFWDASSVSNWTAEELAFIQGFYPGYPENWGDLYRLPAEKMNKVLQDYFGITLEQSNKVCLDRMMYFADTNSYFGGPAGAVGEMNVQMLDGKVAANGTVYLICATDSTKILNRMLLLALNPAPEGAARPYWVQMCIEVKEAQAVTAVMQQTLYLPPDIPAGSHERNSKYFSLRYRADSERHDGGYD